MTSLPLHHYFKQNNTMGRTFSCELTVHYVAGHRTTVSDTSAVTGVKKQELVKPTVSGHFCYL